MNSVRKSIAYSLLSSNAVTALQFFGSLAIARLLTPEQIGIFSVASVVIALAQILRDMGASGYVIQAEKLTGELLQSAFGLALLSAMGIAAALGLASGFIADFYGEPDVREVMLILALNFALTPFGALTVACLRREMRFKAIGMLDFASAIVALATSVSLALLGHEAASLAWGAVAGTLATVLGTIRLRPAYLPWLPRFRGMRPILRFGSLTTASSVLYYLSMNATDLVLGKLASMSAVAYFNRAASLNRFFGNMITKAIGPVLLPAFAEFKRQGRDIGKTFNHSTRLLTAVVWPVYAMIAVLAEPLVLTLFGAQWGAAVPLVPYIATTALISSTYTMCGACYTALGRPSLNLLVEGIHLPIKIGVIVWLAPSGVLAVAQAWPVLALAGAVVHQVLLQRELDVSLSVMLAHLWQSLLVVLITAVGGGLSARFLAGLSVSYHHELSLLGGFGGAALAWLLALQLSRHPLVGELKRIVLTLRPKLG